MQEVAASAHLVAHPPAASGNKKVLNQLALPWLVAVSQLGVGAAYACAVWALGLREAPWSPASPLRRRPGMLWALAPIGAFHGSGQVATVLSLGAGAVSFTHIVKVLPQGGEDARRSLRRRTGGVDKELPLPTSAHIPSQCHLPVLPPAGAPARC